MMERIYTDLAVWMNREAVKATKRESASKIKAAFDGIVLARQTFTINGTTQIQVGEEKFFYKCGEIDSALERLNKVLRELNQ